MTGVAEIDTARRRFSRACALGGALAGIVFTWMLALGRLDLLQSHNFGGFYDAQARSLLNGHWDVPLKTLGFEAFLHDGKPYTYFGPWPAVMRMPIVAVTDRFDGRLTQLSLLAAFVVLLVATSRLLWHVRELTRGTAPVGRLESWAVGGFVAVVGAGSVVLFLASRPLVYHEASLWGAAFSVAAYEMILRFVVHADRRSLAWATTFATLAMLSRGSIGIGPVVALALVLAGRLFVALAARLRRAALGKPAHWLGLAGNGANHGYVVPLVIAVAVPLALYMYVNYAKFGHPWTVPINDQIATTIDPVRREVFAANGGSWFGAKFVPTNLVAAFRPDAIGIDGLFPWISFPERASTFGVTFAEVDPSSSIPVSMPLLTLVAIVGGVAVFRPRRDDEIGIAALRVIALGGLAGGVGMILLAFINHRYLADFVPLLIVLAAAGTHTLLRFVDAPRRVRSATVRTATVVVGLLAGLSLWANFGLALVYQREISPFVPDSERAAFIRFQYALDERLPGGPRGEVRAGPTLPRPLPTGTLFIVGDCDGVYWSSGAEWFPVERTPATGRFPLEVVFPDRSPGTRETLLAAGPPGAQDRLGVEYLREDRVRFWFDSPRLEREILREPHEIDPGHVTDLEIVYDAALERLGVTLDGQSVLGAVTGLAPGPIAVVGADPGDGLDFSGRARLRAVTPDFCRDLVDARETAAAADPGEARVQSPYRLMSDLGGTSVYVRVPI